MAKPAPQPKALPENVEPIRLVHVGDDRRIQACKILKDAKAEKLDEIMVIGRTDEGELWCASSLNAGQSLWLIEKLKEKLLDGSPWAIV